MEYITDYHLVSLTVIMCGIAIYSKNVSAMWYAGLIVLHDLLFQNFHGDGDAVAWAFSSGMFSAMSMVACTYYRNGISDSIAFYLAILSGLWILVNIVHIALWVTYSDVMALNLVFVFLNMASILTIVFGGGGDFDTNRIDDRHNLAYSIYAKCRNRYSEVVHSKGEK